MFAKRARFVINDNKVYGEGNIVNYFTLNTTKLISAQFHIHIYMIKNNEMGLAYSFEKFNVILKQDCSNIGA